MVRRYVGKPICTWCLAPLTGRRSSWCSNECVDAYFLVHDWKSVRAAVLARDKGVCRHCRRDTLKGQRVHDRIVKHCWWIHDPTRTWWQSSSLYNFRESNNPRIKRWCAIAARISTSFGFGPKQWTSREWWEADHIVERVRGGRDHLDNLRTLCLRCHKVETARLARERADERRARIPLVASE